jgi:hypothetical protein
MFYNDPRIGMVQGDLHKADDEDGSWITMNGTHVHMKGGEVDKGPQGIKDHVSAKSGNATQTIEWKNSKGVPMKIEVVRTIEGQSGRIGFNVYANGQKQPGATRGLEPHGGTPGAVARVGNVLLNSENHERVQSAIKELSNHPVIQAINERKESAFAQRMAPTEGEKLKAENERFYTRMSYGERGRVDMEPKPRYYEGRKF